MDTSRDVEHATDDIRVACRRIAQLCRGSEASLQEIGRRVLEVPALSDMALRAANATALGLRKSITRIDQAVLVLGTQRIHSLAQTLEQRELAMRSHAQLVQDNSASRLGTQPDDEVR